MLPPERNTNLDLARLRAWAVEWDDEGDGACWPASRFVQWVERNLSDYETRGVDTRQVNVGGAGDG